MEKHKTNKDVVLPGFALTGSAGNRQPGDPIKTIGSSAFSGKKLDSVDFSFCESVETIGSSAFRNTSLPAIDFSQLPALKTISSHAFRETAINNLDFSPAKNLERIDDYSFSSIKGGIESLNFGELPNLTYLGYRACLHMVVPTRCAQ